MPPAALREWPPGYSQTNLRLGNAAVSVSDQIYAEAVEGSSADADAFGLGVPPFGHVSLQRDGGRQY